MENTRVARSAFHTVLHFAVRKESFLNAKRYPCGS